MALSAKRNKPLRTYGKQSHTTTESRGEPVAKRRRTETKDEWKENTHVSDGPREARSHKVPGDEEEKNLEMTQVKSQEEKKGSILSFFKPIPKPILEEQPTEENEEEGRTDEIEDPVPKTTHRRSKRTSRLLRLRTASLPNIDIPKELTNSSKRHSNASSNDSQLSSSPSSEHPLQEGGQTLHNKRPTRSSFPSASKLPSVQTTLNISCQPAFSECKLCDIVWNPLFPDDVALHKKRHDAVLRKERKRKREEL